MRKSDISIIQKFLQPQYFGNTSKYCPPKIFKLSKMQEKKWHFIKNKTINNVIADVPSNWSIKWKHVEKGLNKCTYNTLVPNFSVSLIFLPATMDQTETSGVRESGHMTEVRRRTLIIPRGKLFILFNCNKGQ